MPQLHDHLTLSFKELGLLVSLSHTTTLNLKLNLHVVLVNPALLSKDIIYLGLCHRFLIFQVLNARSCDRDVNLNQICLLTSLICLLLSLLGKVAVVEPSLLLILGPGQSQDVFVQDLDVLVQSVAQYLHFSLLFILFGLGKLTLFDGSVGYGIVALQSRKSIRQGFMLSLVNLHFVLLLVDGALKSEA